MDIFLKDKAGEAPVQKVPGVPGIPAGFMRCQDIKTQVQNKCAIESNCVWIWGDDAYQRLDPQTVKMFVNICPVCTRPYLPNRHDCEDFAREVKCYMSGDYLCGHAALAVVFANAYDASGNYMFCHGLNIYPSNDGQVYMAEPQHNNDVWQMPGVGSWVMRGVAEFKLVYVSF